MPLDGQSILWRYSYPPGPRDTALPGGDETLSLGGTNTATRLDVVESTLTSAQTDARELVDTARIGAGADEYVDHYIMMMDGAAAPNAAKVTDFDTATGIFRLQEGFGSLAGSGDTYRLFAPNNLFSNLDGVASAAGATKYRCIFLRHQTGTLLTDNRLSIVMLDDAGVDFRFITTNRQGDTVGINSIVDDEDVPDITDLNETPSEPECQFDFALDGTIGPEIPAAGTRRFDTSTDHPLWIEATIPGDRPVRPNGAVQILLRAAETGGSPDPYASGVVIVFNIAGQTPSVTFERDRPLVQGAAARYTATVTSVETGDPIVDQDVDFTLVSGTATLTKGDIDARRTDSNGQSRCGVLASADDGDVGSSVEVEVEV